MRQLRDHVYWWVEAHTRAPCEESAPLPLKEWALDELAKMDGRHREKDAVKDMESMFDDIKDEEATQTKLTGSNKNKGAAAKAVCDKRQGRC